MTLKTPPRSIKRGQKWADGQQGTRQRHKQTWRMTFLTSETGGISQQVSPTQLKASEFTMLKGRSIIAKARCGCSVNKGDLIPIFPKWSFPESQTLRGICYSEWGSVPSEVPQGTKLGPWLILVLIINDLEINNAGNIWKYVDDTTTSEIVVKGASSNSQLIADTVVRIE